MSWRQSKRVRRYTLDKSGSLRLLCFQNIDFDPDMARAKYLLILSGTCVARKKQITPVLSVKSIWWATENTLKTKKYILSLKKVEIRVYEKTTKSVINNVSANSTDSITPDFRLRKGYRFLIRWHSRLQTKVYVIVGFFTDGNFYQCFYKAHRVSTALFKLYSLKKFFRSGKLLINFGSDRQLFQKQALLMVKTNEIC